MHYLKEPDYAHGQQTRTGILLVNLGTPEAPTAKALRTYLKEFLSDPVSYTHLTLPTNREV